MQQRYIKSNTPKGHYEIIFIPLHTLSLKQHKMSKGIQPIILYDNQIFDIQRFGGISRYFCEIIRRLNIKNDIAVRYSINYYLTTYHIGKHRIPLPRFIFKRYRKACQDKNKKLSKILLSKNHNYLFHPTYYDPYFLEYIGNNPYVITVHDMIHEKFSSCFSDADEVINQKKEVITHANRIIAISENTKKDIIELLHINPNKIDVIYHSTSMKAFTGRPNPNIPSKFLLFIGDRTPYKNFNRLIRAFSTLSKEDKELNLVCTGMPFSKSEKEFIDQLGVTDKIIQIKATDKLLCELYSRAKLFIFPSLYEGFGIPILEAYACHCPVALSNASCFPEIAGDAGIYFDPYSEKSIIESIREVIYDENKRSSLIQAGNERLKLFSWEKAARLTERTYLKVITNE